jgi:hypothetical protein
MAFLSCLIKIMHCACVKGEKYPYTPPIITRKHSENQLFSLNDYLKNKVIMVAVNDLHPIKGRSHIATQHSLPSFTL